MMPKRQVAVISTLVVLAILGLGVLPVWPQTNIFGTQKINSYEFLGGCWQGDVRVCDYDPFQ